MHTFLTPEATAFLGLVLCWTLCPIVAGLLFYAGAITPHQRILAWPMATVMLIVWVVLVFAAPQLMRQFLTTFQGAS